MSSDPPSPQPVIRGIVLGAETIGTALVRLASADDLRRLTDGLEVNIAPSVQRVVYNDLRELIAAPIYMRGRDGQFKEVGIVTQIDVRSFALDVTSFGGHATFVPGLGEASMMFTGMVL